MTEIHDNRKLCRACGAKKPIRDFPSKRARICSACRNNTAWLQAQLWANQVGGFPPHTPLTDTAIGWNKYQRERKRVRTLARRTQAGAKPKATPLDAPPRTCLHCKRTLALHLFPGPGRRICIQCDGPPSRLGP